MPFRGRPRKDFAPGYNRSTRAKHRTWPLSDSRSDSYGRSRIDRCTTVCSDRSPRRRTSAERSAASVRPGFHLIVSTRHYTHTHVSNDGLRSNSSMSRKKIWIAQNMTRQLTILESLCWIGWPIKQQKSAPFIFGYLVVGSTAIAWKVFLGTLRGSHSRVRLKEERHLFHVSRE